MSAPTKCIQKRNMRVKLFLTTFLESVGRTPSDAESEHYYNSNEEAIQIASDPSKVQALLDNVNAKAHHFKEDVKTLADMVEMHYKKKYTMDSFDLLLVLACLVYIATPIDAVPDFLPVVGYVDDAAVVAHTVDTIHDNKIKFERWKGRNITLYHAGKDEQCCDNCVIL